jgi:penicillin-binding protein 1C
MSSWPGLSRLRGRSRFGEAKARPSTSYSLQSGTKDVDARLKAGHDELFLRNQRDPSRVLPA